MAFELGDKCFTASLLFLRGLRSIAFALTKTFRHPELYVRIPNIAHTPFGDADTRPVAIHLAGENSRAPVDTESKHCVLQNGTVSLLEHVIQVVKHVLANLVHVRVKAGLKRHVALFGGKSHE